MLCPPFGGNSIHLRGRYTAHLLSQSYKCETFQIFFQQITFSSVSLKIRVNRPIVKLDGKEMIRVCIWVFYDDSKPSVN